MPRLETRNQELGIGNLSSGYSFLVTKAGGKVARKLWKALGQATYLSPALLRFRNWLGTNTPTSTHVSRTLYSAFPTHNSRQSPLFFSQSSPLSTGPIKTRTKYMNNLGVIV